MFIQNIFQVFMTSTNASLSIFGGLQPPHLQSQTIFAAMDFYIHINSYDFNVSNIRSSGCHFLA